MSLLSFSSMSSLDVCECPLCLFLLTFSVYNERSIFVRERANGMYTTSAYFVARAICDIIPMRVLPTIILGSTTYFMIGMDTSMWSTFLSFIGISSLFVLFSLVLHFSHSVRCVGGYISLRLIPLLRRIHHLPFPGVCQSSHHFDAALLHALWWLLGGHEVRRTPEDTGLHLFLEVSPCNPTAAHHLSASDSICW